MFASLSSWIWGEQVADENQDPANNAIENAETLGYVLPTRKDLETDHPDVVLAEESDWMFVEDIASNNSNTWKTMSKRKRTKPVQLEVSERPKHLETVLNNVCRLKPKPQGYHDEIHPKFVDMTREYREEVPNMKPRQDVYDSRLMHKRTRRASRKEEQVCKGDKPADILRLMHEAESLQKGVSTRAALNQKMTNELMSSSNAHKRRHRYSAQVFSGACNNRSHC